MLEETRRERRRKFWNRIRDMAINIAYTLILRKLDKPKK